jgi:hypothetical protein
VRERALSMYHHSLVPGVVVLPARDDQQTSLNTKTLLH